MILEHQHGDSIVELRAVQARLRHDRPSTIGGGNCSHAASAEPAQPAANSTIATPAASARERVTSTPGRSLGNDVHDTAAVVAEIGLRHALHVFGGDGGKRLQALVHRADTPKLTYRARCDSLFVGVSMPESRSTSIWRFALANSPDGTGSSRSRWISAMKRRSTSSTSRPDARSRRRRRVPRPAAPSTRPARRAPALCRRPASGRARTAPPGEHETRDVEGFRVGMPDRGCVPRGGEMGCARRSGRRRGAPHAVPVPSSGCAGSRDRLEAPKARRTRARHRSRRSRRNRDHDVVGA